MTKKQILAARQVCHVRQVEILQAANAEGRELNDSEQTEYDNLDTEYDRLTVQVDALNTQEDRSAAMALDEAREVASTGVAAAGGSASSASAVADDNPNDGQIRAGENPAREVRGALEAWREADHNLAEIETPHRVLVREARRVVEAFFRHGFGSLTPRAQAILGQPQTLDGERRDMLESALVDEGIVNARALAAGTAAAGGNVVPDDLMRPLVEAQAAWGGMFRHRCERIQTSTGREIPMPTSDDTGNTGARIAENVEVDELDVTYGQKLLNAYLYTSKLIRVPRPLMEDSAIDIAAHVGRIGGRRLGTIQNLELTTADGSGKPNGVVTASTLGKTAASATLITYLELIDLKFSVDQAYRIMAEWGFQDGFFKAVKKLLDGDSRPIFAPDVQSGRIDLIDGDPFQINNDMAAIATGNKVALYGDFFEYKIRTVNGVLVLRLEERFAEFNQVGFVMFHRLDGELMDAGTAPIKHYIMA